MNLKVAISVKPQNFYDNLLQDPDKFTKLKNLWHLRSSSPSRIKTQMAARLLLEDLLKKEKFQIPLEALALRQSDTYQLTSELLQKPNVSISHSKNAIAACISLEKNVFVGIDIEDENRMIPEGTEKYFIHAKDYCFGVKSNEDKLKIWTSKEAAFKAVFVLSKQEFLKVVPPQNLNEFQLVDCDTFLYRENLMGKIKIYSKEYSQIVALATITL